MTKEQFVEDYLDTYERQHPNERIDYDAVREQADCAWYDREVDAGHKTEYDLTKEQEKASKDMRKGARAVNAYGKEVKRTRKANDVKRWIMGVVKTLFEGFQLNGKCEAVNLSNEERTLDFTVNGKSYTLTLTEHRDKKS
jgi:hypothetical protein